jgi:Leucine-rich repeat (LRR) protein
VFEFNRNNGFKIAKSPLIAGLIIIMLAFLFSCSDDDSSTEPGDGIPPLEITNLLISHDNSSAILSWTNPVDWDFAGVIIRRSENVYPATHTDGDSVFIGNISSYTDTGLENGTEYFYSIFAYDNDMNYSDAVTASIVPHIPLVVIFEDDKLERKIREEIGIPSVDIYDDDLLQLYELEADYDSISHLSGIQYCINLTKLELDNNVLTDSSGTELLGQLDKLELLNLSDNNLTIVPDLSNLSELQTLYLSWNELTSLTPLNNMTKLTTLSIEGIGDLDISPLINLINLEKLFVSYNDIVNIETISSLTNLTLLTAIDSNISNIDFVENLVNLDRLLLSQNQISDIAPLANLQQLTTLTLNANSDILDYSVLSDLSSLKTLQISYNLIVDISFLSDVVGLDNLSLDSNLITDIQVLVDNEGLGDGDYLWINGMSATLSQDVYDTQIPALQSRGVNVDYDSYK